METNKPEKYKQLTILETLEARGRLHPRPRGGNTVSESCGEENSNRSLGSVGKDPMSPVVIDLTSEECPDQNKDDLDSQLNDEMGLRVKELKTRESATLGTIIRDSDNTDTMVAKQTNSPIVIVDASPNKSGLPDTVTVASVDNILASCEETSSDTERTSKGVTLVAAVDNMTTNTVTSMAGSGHTLEKKGSQKRHTRRTLRGVHLRKADSPRTEVIESNDDDRASNIVIKRKRKNVRHGPPAAKQFKPDTDPKGAGDKKSGKKADSSSQITDTDNKKKLRSRKDKHNTTAVARVGSNLKPDKTDSSADSGQITDVVGDPGEVGSKLRSGEDECDALESEYDIVMVSTPQQKEARRLARLKQLKEMKIREMKEERMQRALKRRGEVGPLKKLSASDSLAKRVSWKEETSLVSVFNYSPPLDTSQEV